MSSLSHLKVLGLSRVLAGSWASQILVDLGAEVIKIENPKGGDDTRHWGLSFLKSDDGGDSSESAYFYAPTVANSRSVWIFAPSKAKQHYTNWSPNAMY